MRPANNATYPSYIFSVVEKFLQQVMLMIFLIVLTTHSVEVESEAVILNATHVSRNLLTFLKICVLLCQKLFAMIQQTADLLTAIVETLMWSKSFVS